jgi:hypothetical protein
MDEQYWILCEQCQPLKNRICQISANSVKILMMLCSNSVECQSLFSFRVTEFRCPAPLSALSTVVYCACVVTAVAKNWCRCGASQEEQGHCSGLGNLWCCVCSSPRTASGTVQYCPKAKEWRRVVRCAAVRASVPLGLRSPAVGSLTRGPYLIAGPTCQKPYWQEAVPLSLAAPPDVIYCDTVFSLDLVRIRGPFIRTGREQDSAWALSAPWSNSTGRSPAVPLAPHWPWTWRAESLSANSGAILFGRSCSCSTDSTCRKMSI